MFETVRPFTAAGESPGSRVEKSPAAEIRAILVNQVYDRAPIGLMTTFANALILVAVLWGWIHPSVLLIWLMATLMLTLFRWINAQRFHHRDPAEATDYAYWETSYLVGFGLSGCLWGLTGVFLFPAGSPTHQMFLALILCGMVGGTVATFAALPLAFPVFSIPALTPIFIRFLSIPDPIHMAMALLTVVFVLLTAFSARRSWRDNRELVFLRQRFSEELDTRTAGLETANRRLEASLAEEEVNGKALRKRVRTLETRERILRAAGAVSGVSDMARALLPEIRAILQVDFAILQVVRSRGLEIAAYDPETVDFFPEDDHASLDQCLCGKAAMGGDAVFARNIHLDRRCSREECKEIGMVSAASIPLMDSRQIIGLLTLGSRVERLFEEEADYLRTVSEPVAVGLRNALMVERMKKETARSAGDG
jgi:hypothetical protein